MFMTKSAEDASEELYYFKSNFVHLMYQKEDFHIVKIDSPKS